MRRLAGALGLGFALVACAHASLAKPEPNAGYATAPLRDPVFEPARVATEADSLDEWLTANYAQLPPENHGGPREHLFYLIDSRVKELYGSTGTVLPKEPDPVLASFYRWAEPLGVYGGGQVYAALRPADARGSGAKLQVPAPFSLTLEADAFRLTSSVGDWSVRFPYHFMPWRLQDFVAKSGMPTQLATISTGAARHATREGHSQSTLMLVFSPKADHAKFVEAWTALFQVGDALPGDVNSLEGARNRVFVDPQTDVHTEMVHWQAPAGSAALMYSGVSGPYEHNRPYFIDFLRNLAGGIAPGARPAQP